MDMRVGLPDTYPIKGIESESIVIKRIYPNDYRDLTPFSPKLSRPPYFIASGVKYFAVSVELFPGVGQRTACEAVLDSPLSLPSDSPPQV